MKPLNINRRDALKTLACTAAALASPQSLIAAEETTNKPNFIIMIADDLGWNDFGSYGHPHIRTPNIDNLAAQGMKFDNAFLTCASCSPTRCSIMTGRYPHSTGAGELHQQLPADQVVFAGLLKNTGYYTAAAGKWHLGLSARKNFDSILDGGPSGCDKWVQTLQDRPKDKPFFLWLAAIDAHRPYKPNTIPNPHNPKDVVVPPFLPDTDETRKDLALYYDEIARLDSYLGKVLDELEKQNLTDNTFVLFLSDNGRPFPRCKTTIYDSGVKTPFIVRYPKLTQPHTTCQNLVSTIDIAPSILELAGLKPPPTFQGKSFVPLLTDPHKSIRKYVFAEHNWHDYQAHDRAVRSKQFLYIRNTYTHLPATPPADAVQSITFQKMQNLLQQKKLNKDQMGCFNTPRPAEELYDVLKDPYSLNNLVSDSRHTPTLKTLRRALDNWIKNTTDKIPQNPTPDRFDRITGRALKNTS